MAMDRQYFKSNISPVTTYRGSVEYTLNVIADIVGRTLGPGGASNLFKQGPDTFASKDGLENLSMISFDASIPAVVYQMALDVANDQANAVGDGTTTAILLVAYLYRHLINDKTLLDNYTPSEINTAMRNIQAKLEEYLTENALQMKSDDGDVDMELVEDLLRTTLNGNTELVELLAGLCINTPDFENTNILLDYSNTTNSYYNVVQGLNTMGKLMCPAFGNVASDICNLKNAEVIIVDGKVNIMNDILTYVNKLKPQNKSLLILCSGVNDNFYRYIESIAQTKQAPMLANFCVAYTNANTIMDRDTFYDIINSVDTVFLPENSEISTETIDNIKIGFAENVSIKNGQITLGGCRKGENFDTYTGAIHDQIAELVRDAESISLTPSDAASVNVQLSKLKARYARLTAGVTTVYAGGDTYQTKHINFRAIEDGIKALQSGIKHGFFEGCNTMVINMLANIIGNQIDADIRNGLDTSLYYELEKCLICAYFDIYKRIIRNRAVRTDKEIFDLMVDDETWYDETTGYIKLNDPLIRDIIIRPVDITGRGKAIINPAKTDINIVRKAIDAATVLLTTGTIITDKTEFEAEYDSTII